MNSVKIKTKKNQGIESYVNYLLEDIGNAERQQEKIKSTGELAIDDLRKCFDEIERFMDEQPLHSFSQLCGLEAEQFPPAEQLSIKQLKQVIKAFHKMLSTWNIGADIPKKVPHAKHYSLLVGILHEKTHFIENGLAVFDFCSGNPEGCAFEEYCECLKFFRKDNNKKEIKREV